MTDERGSASPAAQAALQPAEPGIAARPVAGRRQAGAATVAQWLAPGSVPHAPQPTRQSAARSETRASGPGQGQAALAAEAPSPASNADVAAWGVQVGSFAERDNAMRLSGWCREHGYEARIAPTTGQSVRLYRVRVGPFATRERARSAVAELALLGHSGFVTDWAE